MRNFDSQKRPGLNEFTIIYIEKIKSLHGDTVLILNFLIRNFFNTKNSTRHKV